MKGECGVLKEKEKARDKDCEELKAKCEASMEDFDKNPVVMVVALEAEKGKLEAAKALPREKIKALKCDREEVVSKVVPYVAINLVHRDEMAMLVGRLVSSVVFYWRCVALKEAENMKEPFDLAKVKGYRPMDMKEHTKAGNDLVAATFPFLSEVVAYPSASVEALLSKKPKSLCRPTPTKTNAPSHPTTHPPLPRSYIEAYVSSPRILKATMW
ncbi:hypothetical protein Tco_0610994 [Tanacetum coccineum]